MTTTAPSPKRRRNGRRLIFIVGALVLLVGLIATLAFNLLARQEAPESLPAGWQVVPVSSGGIAASVSATGNIEPQAEASLRFATNGTVAEILVQPGDTVEASQPLARIDSEGLVLRVEQAQADLRQAQAELEGLLAGASEAELAEASARVEQARRQYSQASASVSPAEIAAARADLESARARLARLEAGPANDELASANERVQSARTNLENARVSLSATKERARIDVETRANNLRNLQDEFSRIYWQNRELEKLPGELPREREDQEVTAQRAVADAEAALQAAQTAYDQARQEEINSLQAREAELTSAEAARTRLLDGAEAEDLASAQAAVQRAQATLEQLTGTQRQRELAAQQTNITIAQAGLDRLLADPTASNLTVRQAAVARAEVALKSAERDLDLGTLRAPFAATIADVTMRVGEPADATASIAVVDLRSFHLDLPVDELDIAQVRNGQRAEIELDALPGMIFGGEVTNIAPQAIRSETGTTTYKVTVTLDAGSEGVRPGMTAVAAIITDEKQEVVLVPRRAVRVEQGQSFVLVPGAMPQVALEPEALPGERRVIEVGLSNSEMVEVLSGLTAGEEVLVQDVVTTFTPSGRPNQ